MAIQITDDCINCGACAPECPNNAIYENGALWTMNEGTTILTEYTLRNGDKIDPFKEQSALSTDYFYIVPDKCTECVGFYDEPQCATVCPVDCCLPDTDFVESEDELEAKQQKLHE